jgi:hypothetical protein
MLSEQDKQDLIGFAVVGNALKDEKMLGALADTIRRLGVVNVLTWVATQDERRKFYKRILATCEMVTREDGVTYGSA